MEAIPHQEDRVQSEPLGTMSVAGVTAEGTRTRRTIPAGAIGNALPIEIVTELWHSPELQTIVAATIQNPLRANLSFRLRSLNRVEPPAGIFEVQAERVVQPEQLRERRPHK
jgi:hypothetical protein